MYFAYVIGMPFKGEQGTADLGAQSFETIKLTMFPETGAAFAYCNWSIKITRTFRFGSTCVDRGLFNHWNVFL